MTDRVVVFIDYQNVKESARDVFFQPSDFHTRGQFDPLALGQVLASRQVTRRPRTLHQVRVYTGQPSSGRDPRGYGARQRQIATWRRSPQVVVFPRALKYPPGWPQAGGEKPREKGVDVALAVDFVALRILGEYDVGIIFSSDTDLLPALEASFKLLKTGDELPEVACWGSPRTGRSRLQVSDQTMRCHWLDRQEFNRVADSTDYNIRKTTP